MRRLFAAVALMTSLAMTACSPAGSARSDGTATPAVTASPLTGIEIVMRSADALQTTSVHTVSSSTLGDATDGDLDLSRNLVDLKSTLSGSVVGATRRIGNDAYTQLVGSPWLHLEVSRLRPESPTMLQLRFRSVTKILLGVTEVTRTSPLHYEGKSDLTKAMAAASGRDRTDLQAILTVIDPNVPISFTVALDDQNRLRSIEYVLPTSEPITYTSSFTEYGKAVTVARPPANEVKEATEAQYGQY